jgi:hypothetical protein
VQLTSASAEMLASYPVILLAGDITFDDALVAKLEDALKRGGKVLLSAAQQTAMDPKLFARLAKYPGVEVLEAWTHPATGRSTAISNSRLQRLADEALPVTVSGDPIQYQVNRTADGWVVELVNNAGIVKKPGEPQVTDPNAIARVLLKPTIRCASAKEWRSNSTYPNPEEIRVEVGLGQSVFVELIQQK